MTRTKSLILSLSLVASLVACQQPLPNPTPIPSPPVPCQATVSDGVFMQKSSVKNYGYLYDPTNPSNNLNYQRPTAISLIVEKECRDQNVRVTNGPIYRKDSNNGLAARFDSRYIANTRLTNQYDRTDGSRVYQFAYLMEGPWVNTWNTVLGQVVTFEIGEGAQATNLKSLNSVRSLYFNPQIDVPPFNFPFATDYPSALL